MAIGALAVVDRSVGCCGRRRRMVQGGGQGGGVVVVGQRWPLLLVQGVGLRVTWTWAVIVGHLDVAWMDWWFVG